MIQIRHQVPGRVRLGVPALREDPSLSPRLVAALREESGVREVRANCACASVVVHFEPGRFDAAALASRLRPLLAPVPAAAERGGALALPDRRPGPAGHGGSGKCGRGGGRRAGQRPGQGSVRTAAWLARWRRLLRGGDSLRGPVASPRSPSGAGPGALVAAAGVSPPSEGPGGDRRWGWFRAAPGAESSSVAKPASAPVSGRALPRRAAVDGAGGCSLLCRLHLRLVRWMVRTTWRCWRAELAAGHPGAPARVQDLAVRGIRHGRDPEALPGSPARTGALLSWREALAVLRPVGDAAPAVCAPRTWALRRAARPGVLMKGGEAIERPGFL